MTKYKLSTLVILSFFYLKVSIAQVAQPAGKLYVNTAPSGIVKHIPYTEHIEKTTEFYLFDEWKKGEIELNKKMKLKSDEIRYDLMNGIFEIKYSNEMKYLQMGFVKSFYLEDNIKGKLWFKNGNDIKHNEVPLVGFLEVLNEGAFSLYSLKKLERIPQSYNQALDVGERGDSYTLKEVLYFEGPDGVKKVNKKKKKFVEEFDNMKPEILSYINEQKVSLKNKNDLIGLFDFINEKWELVK